MLYVNHLIDKLRQGKKVEVHFDTFNNIMGVYFANSKVTLTDYAKIKHKLTLESEQKHPQTKKVWIRWYKYNEAI